MAPHRPFRFTVQASHLHATEDLLPFARRAEDLGVSVLTVADHLDEQVAPIAALMAVADATTTLRIGSLVLATDYRHPAVVAQELATIDRLSGGRLEVGIGAGWKATDYAAANIAMDRPSIRIARLEEAVQVIRGLWSDGPLNFEGDHYTITEMNGAPKPLQRPCPPVVIGGGGRKVLSVAGRHADIVHLNPSLPAGVIDERAGATATAASTDQKIAWVRAAAGDRFDSLTFAVRVHLAVVTADDAARREIIELLAGGFGLTPEEAELTPHALCGTVDQICEALEYRRDRFGISDIGISASVMDDLAPVITRMSGT
ncbi:MAG: TIGR03621 family F420-dependent LLM class oxidoreductase [Actinomycetes bacterium]